jgi:hypothetical protein
VAIAEAKYNTRSPGHSLRQTGDRFSDVWPDGQVGGSRRLNEYAAFNARDASAGRVTAGRCRLQLLWPLMPKHVTY